MILALILATIVVWYWCLQALMLLDSLHIPCPYDLLFKVDLIAWFVDDPWIKLLEREKS